MKDFTNCQYRFFGSAGKASIFFFLIIFLSGCSRLGSYNRSIPLLGTIVNIKISDSSQPDAICSEAIKRMKDLEKSLSRFDPNSQVSVINNRQPDQAIPISDDVYQLLQLSTYLNSISEGAFDITVGPLMKVWGFYSDNKGVRPDESAILAALDDVGSDKISIDDNKNVLKIANPRIELDFSAVAKGYIVDRAAEVLKTGGVKNAIIDAGGDVLCIGLNNGNDCVVGIRDPRNRRGVIAKILMRGKAVATSGGYENFIMLDNKKIPHIIDPRTGYPPNNNVLSATVIADNLALADGLATSFYILEPDRSMKIAESLDSVDCIIIAREDGEIKFYISNGIQKDIEIL